MSSETKSCYINPFDESMPSVFLPDKQDVFVGRCVETKITDTQCSRKQVRLHANYAEKKVFIEQLGSRVSGLNGFRISKFVQFIAGHGDCVEILYGKHLYKIEFNPPPPPNVDNDSQVKKRVLSEDSDEEKSLRLKKSKVVEKMEDSPSTSNSIDNSKYEETPSTSTSLYSSQSSSSSESGTWKDSKFLYVYTSSNCKGRSKIAAYDMDNTLIKTISGLKFPKDCNDWQLLYPEVPTKLKKFYNEGYKVVIMSNQGALGTSKAPVKDFKLKIERIVKKIGIPMQVYLAVGQSIYRKPRTGMWNILEKENNDSVKVDKFNSFYIGDAAGRPATANRKKKDHSLADRLLAQNLNLSFNTPEEHFLGHQEAEYKTPTFHPKEASKNTVLYEPPDAKLISNKQELIIMVGCQGSGKSHFARIHLKSYNYINRDILGSWQKCVGKADEALAQGKSVVVDNTNPDKPTRQRYIDIAKKHNVPVRCFVMTLEKEHIKHNNMFRILTDPTHQAISDMLINSYLKNFTPPSEDEGYSEIVKVNFVPSFKSDEDRKLYEMYLLG